MTYRFLKRLMLLAIGGLLVGTVPGQASEWHQFDIINNSSRYMQILSTTGRCVSDIPTYSTGISPGNRITIRWNDSNDSGIDCTNRDKWLAFTFYLEGSQSWHGWLGVTHRKLSGSSWYNGQFYAANLGVYDNGYIWLDGPPPPNWVKALCSNNNDCFGSFTQMEQNGKDGYNWPRSYQTESGWAFRIDNPS